jgi:hypothetical protein
MRNVALLLKIHAITILVGHQEMFTTISRQVILSVVVDLHLIPIAMIATNPVDNREEVVVEVEVGEEYPLVMEKYLELF